MIIALSNRITSVFMCADRFLGVSSRSGLASLRVGDVALTGLPRGAPPGPPDSLRPSNKTNSRPNPFRWWRRGGARSVSCQNACGFRRHWMGVQCEFLNSSVAMQRYLTRRVNCNWYTLSWGAVQMDNRLIVNTMITKFYTHTFS